MKGFAGFFVEPQTPSRPSGHQETVQRQTKDRGALSGPRRGPRRLAALAVEEPFAVPVSFLPNSGPPPGRLLTANGPPELATLCLGTMD